MEKRFLLLSSKSVGTGLFVMVLYNPGLMRVMHNGRCETPATMVQTFTMTPCENMHFFADGAKVKH